ncbi:MAG: putative porin [Muribaculaceae bacterium]|nr:putative porin [Muribaculaceae bacterium]
MNKLSIAAIIILAVAPMLPAKKSEPVAPPTAWEALEPLGLREPCGIDTLEYNYFQASIPSARSDAWATTGNYGSEGINMIFSERLPYSYFFLGDALRTWKPRQQKFYNTRLPMTLLGYTTGGGRDTKQDHLTATFSGNIDRRSQVGGMFDYLYSKGSYAEQAAKDVTWGLSGSHIGDRYEFQGYFNHYNLLNKENGGITDPLYIIDPAEVQGGVTTIDSKSIPTRLSHAHTRNIGTDLWLNNRYKIGYWQTAQDTDSLGELLPDSLQKRTYVPVTSFVWTFRYREQKHIFTDNNTAETREFFENTYLDPTMTYDSTSVSSVTNTVGIQLLEGFHKYAKFGLSAYVTHEYRRFKQTADTIDHSDNAALGLTPLPEGAAAMAGHKSQNLAWAGAQLTKLKGSVLTYDATAELGILGDVAGDLRLRGNVRSRVPLFGDSLRVHAYGEFLNEETPYLLRHYRSNHFIWNNDFGKQRTYAFGGSVELGRTGTTIDAGLKNLQNYVYFGQDFMPRQHGGNVQVFHARLQQNLRLGILNWRNTVTYQMSSDQSVLPLPKLAVYSNLFLLFRVATLHVQLGIDCDWYTKYYAPAYQPALATFVVQDKQKLGNYPFMNVYANMKLGRTRFFVMMSHISQGWFGNEYFSVVDYPLNPRRLQMGLSVDFAN